MKAATRSLVLWLTVLATVLGPLTGGLAHAFEDDHGDEHGLLAEASATHGECDAWWAETEAHDLHHELQFEPAAQAHHGDHAALCPTCGHATAAVSSRSERIAGLKAADGSAVLRGAFPGNLSHSSARPRGPPTAS